MVTVLLRGEAQAIVIGPHIRVRVISVIGPCAEIAIEAPDHMLAIREETAEEIKGLIPGLQPRCLEYAESMRPR